MSDFSVGFVDSLFGEKIEIEVPGPDGEVLKRTVTRKWWDQMVAEGKIGPVDDLQDRASTLVAAANASAVAMYEPLSERFALLRDIDPDNWDFFATVAGVFIAATRLNNLGIADTREERLMEVVARIFAEWNSDAIRAFEDCRDLFDREFDRLSSVAYDPQFLALDALGIWITWNLLGHQPRTNDEVAFVRAAGTMVTHTFYDWWVSR
jgi:hypothetical protein